MKYAVNTCRRKSYKKHKLTEEYTRGIYSIQYWRLRCTILDNLNDSPKTLLFNANKSGLLHFDNNITSVQTCTFGINNARYRIKQDITKQAQSKERYQADLSSDIIDRKYSHLSHLTSLSDKVERDDLIEWKLKYMYEANARRNLFTMLRFDIKGFIDPDSVKRSAITIVDVTIDVRIAPLTTKIEIEDHLLQRNPQAYWASGNTPFGHTPLGLSLGPTGDSSLANSILNGTFTHPNLAIQAFTSQLRRRPHCPDIPKATAKLFSRAFGGLLEKPTSSPSGLYNAHYMCLAAKRNDVTSNPTRKIHAQLMDLTLTHGFASDRHLT
jgi:hypothetical protein